MAASVRTARYGEWASPLSAEEAASGAPRFAGLALSRDREGRILLWWSALVGGANAVFRFSGNNVEQIAAVRSARSRVNEYGGGAFWVHGETLFWVEDDDQRVYRLDPGQPAVALTPAPPTPRSHRYAAGSMSPDGSWMVLEREVHPVGGVPDSAALAEVISDLVWLRATPQGLDGAVEPVSLIGSADFTAAPCVSPDGTCLAWLQWDHPDMPWDAAELWAAEVVVDPPGRAAELRAPGRVAGGRSDADFPELGRAVSVCLPQWSPTGVLHFCDDRDDLWLLRSCPTPGLPGEGGGERSAPVHRGPGEVGEARWVAGGGRYGFRDDSSVVLAETIDGLDRLISPDRDGGSTTLGPAAVTEVESLVVDGTYVAAVVGSPRCSTAVMLSDSEGFIEMGGSAAPLEMDSISDPQPITFGTGADPDDPGAPVAHAMFYEPRLAHTTGLAEELAPLVVRIHGGPTAHARAELNPSVQFWTTRGFAVVDVNYRGSTGFGRRYRDALNGLWGVADVQDCIAAAHHLAVTGRVDRNRCVIRGGSAGGFTAIEAVCAPDGPDGFRFAAATCLYGVTDLMAMARDTHKFESRYLDNLIGSLPSAREIYRQRSPLHHAERIGAPVLVLHGLDDRVVPPSQAEVLVAAMTENGIEHEYRTYEGEGHGFRLGSTVIDAYGAELDFYGRVLGFSPV